MTAICLIRHGETNWNKEGKIQGQTDIPLNETGKAQAKQCAMMLEESKWDTIITSPLSRAKQTAEIINDHLQLPMMEMDAFIERGYGAAEGMTKEERETLFSNREYPNMEPRETVIARIDSGLKHIAKTYPDQKVLLIAHGGIINTILSMLSGGTIGSGKTILANACLSNIYLENGNWHIQDFNQRSYLAR